jgi:hypothetical protein
MSAWWITLSSAQQFFYCIAFMGSCLLVVQTILLCLGIDHMEFHGGGQDPAGGHTSFLSVISLRTITAFCTGFGWVGVIMTKWGGALPLTMLVAILMGVVLAWCVLLLMDSMRFLSSDGTMDYANAINTVGTVIVSIQAAGQTGGQVEIMVQGRLAVINAVGDVPGPVIAPGTKVRVTGLTDQTTLRVVPA